MTPAMSVHFEYLSQFHPLTEAEYGLLTSELVSRSFKKGDILLQPGQIQRELYFVQSGVQMSWLETERKTHVLAFTYPPNLCAVPEAFSLQRPSPFYLSCLADSEMGCLSFEKLQQIFDRSQAIERLFRKLAEAYLAGLINRHLELHALGMEERFKVFCRRSPSLLHLVPHKYLASYLGIDATNFSKLYNTVRF
jgi:CRP-like cAMP-binding protein